MNKLRKVSPEYFNNFDKIVIFHTPIIYGRYTFYFESNVKDLLDVCRHRPMKSLSSVCPSFCPSVRHEVISRLGH